MVIFKCPFCRTDYEMMTARLSFQQRSYAKCQVCNETMYTGIPETYPSSRSGVHPWASVRHPNRDDAGGGRAESIGSRS